jgi:DNA repair protein RadA/Sms
LRVAEPAVDLGVAIAIASSFRDRPVERSTVVVGEIGLSGELRSVNQLDRRLNEAARLGFARVIVPATVGKPHLTASGIEIVRAASAAEAIEAAIP